ncbi:MAG: isopentenyl phosphate kinase [archaeon]
MGGLIFIKLGGSAITNKSIPNSVNQQVLGQAAKEISSVCKDYKILIGHGGGSFAHPVAEKYKVQTGLQDSGLDGFNKTRHAVEKLGKIVTDSLKSASVPAVWLSAFSCTLMKNSEITEMFISPIEQLLESGNVLVIPGDVCMDSRQVFSIASTEMLFTFLAKKLKPAKIIIGTDVDGVLDENNETIPEINSSNLSSVLKKISSSAVPDVTGGMRHKIEELSKIGAQIQIINLKKKGILKKAILGGTVPGTAIK